MSNKTYDILKWVAQLVLPALATFMMSMGNIWSIPYADQISLTIMALDTFLGAILGISASNYKKLQNSEKEDSF